MSSYYVATSALTSPIRTSVMRAQTELARVQKELASGRRSDAGLTLGAESTVAVRHHQLGDWHRALSATQAQGAARLDAGQVALEGIKSTAQSFLGQLVAAKSAGSSAPLVAVSASLALDALTGALNTAHGGVHVFGGNNGAAAPLAQYDPSTGPGPKSVIDAAFAATFGMQPNDPRVATISASAMSLFVDGALAAEFSGSSWTANWSKASERAATMRISLNERVEVGGNANDLPHRQLAQAYVMIGKIGTAQLNSAALDVVLDKATALVGSAISGIGALQARMGASQHRLTSATLELGQTSTLIDTQLTALERADPYVAATQVNTLLTQLQASYAATARIQKISILNYI